MKKRIFSILLTIAILCSLLPAVPAHGAGHSYQKDWRFWSQGASGYSAMLKGCRLVAQAKLMKEAGVVNASFTPDTWFEWMVDNKGVVSKTNVNERFSNASGDKMLTYIKSQGVTASRVAILSMSSMSASQRVSKIMEYIRQGYYVILEAPGHQTYISRVDSLKAGTPKISDSGGKNKIGPLYSYHGKASAYGGIYSDNKIYFTEANYNKAYVYQIGAATVAATPTLQSSNFEGGVKISLSTSTSGATVYYTTDNTKPTTASAKYTGPISLTASATVKAIAVKSGLIESSVMTKKVTVNQTATPEITVKATATGYCVTISATEGSSVFYTTDGTAPTVESTRYSGQFMVTDAATIRAVAVKAGMGVSNTASAVCSASVPKAPTAELDGASSPVIGIGDSTTIRWTDVDCAYAYVCTATKDGQAVYTETVQTTIATFTLQEAGSYKITVKAVNFMGESEESAPAITVTVKDDVSVTFVDHDDTVLSQQTIKYGGSAMAPAAPSREGHTFTKWSGNYAGVKKDTTVRAVYIPNTYTIRFQDSDGGLISGEMVEYGKAVTNIPQAPQKTGYVFAAWSLKSGEGDSYTQVNGSAVFEPTYTWSDPDLPVALEITKAMRNDNANGYTVTVSAVNGSEEAIYGKLVTAIKTQNGKVIATKIDLITVPANAKDFKQTVSLGGTAVGTVAEVYVVANDKENDNRTGGALSKVASAQVITSSTSTVTYWGDWTQWSTTKPNATDTREIVQKTQYRYSDLETTSSTSSSMEGWTQTGSTVIYGAWGGWSTWSTTKQTASTTKNVETRTVYVYQHYCDGNGRIAPSDSYSYGKYGPHTLYFTTKQAVSRTSSTGYTITDGLSKCAKGATGYYYMGTATQYRYRTRTATTQYSYSRWSAFSEWADTAVTGSSSRTVETRTVYRYRDLITASVTEDQTYLGEEDLGGTVYHMVGTIENVEVDYSGKSAVVMVYKDRNVDPTEDQMEYIGQITVGEGNSYDFTFIPREEISVETGNYVISFGIATADGLVNNVRIIEAPKPVYNVVFKDAEGNILSQQDVVQGEDAIPPQIPEMQGYEMFWNRSFTNIYRDTEIRAVATAKTYPVIFVDWVNDEIVSVEEMAYGQQIQFPEACTATGKIFKGWSVPEDTIVAGTTVVEAIYDDVTYNVTFRNLDGSVYITQQVPHGTAVALPEEDPTAEGYAFVAWSQDSRWWNVTSDISIAPVFVYAETVENPTVTFPNSEDGESTVNFDNGCAEMESTTEESVIHFTTDGSDPTEEDLIFEDILWVEETTTIRAAAFKKGMNPSDVVEFTIEVFSASDIPGVAAVTNISKYQIGTDTAKIPMRIDNPNGYGILSYGFMLENAVTGEIRDYVNELEQPITDTVVGRVFSISALETGTTYKYTLFAEFEGIGLASTEDLQFTTLGEHEHQFVNGICHCGAEDESQITVDNTVQIMKTLDLASDISINFVVYASQVKSYESYYMECVLPVYENNVLTQTKTVKIDPVANGKYIYFKLTGMTAIQMNDEVEVTLRMEKDGKQYASEVTVYSVATYAYNQMGKTNVSEKIKTLCANLLQYGSYAQRYKNYRTDRLADENLTDEQKALLGDVQTVVFGNNDRVLSDLDNATITWKGKGLDLASKVTMKFVFDPTAYEGSVEDLALHISYSNVSGERKETVVTGADLYSSAKGWYAFSFDGLLAAELRNVVSVQIFRGDTPVSCTLKYSADTYGNNKNGLLYELCGALMVYSDSARDYFAN